MLHPRIPDDASLLPGQDDKGKRVKINSRGGALANVSGTVLVGPYTYQYLHKFQVKPKNETKDRYGRDRVKYKEEIRTSNPLWLVLVEGYDREFSFIEEELAFG